MFNLDWKHGHQTTEGVPAKFLGAACCQSCLIFLINDKVIWSVDRMGKGNDPSYGSIVNKPAPSKWINVYYNRSNNFNSCVTMYDTEDAAMKNRAPVDLGGKPYLGTFEVKEKTA